MSKQSCALDSLAFPFHWSAVILKCPSHPFLYLAVESRFSNNMSSSFIPHFKAIALGLIYGDTAYFKSGWNALDGSLVITSMVDLIMTVIMGAASKIFGILRVFRLVRALRPLRVINRAPGLKLVVQGGFAIDGNSPNDG